MRWLSFASRMRPMLQCVGHIALMGIPPKMPWIDAPKMAVTAGMCRLVLRRWRITMGTIAHFSMRKQFLLAYLNATVAFRTL